MGWFGSAPSKVSSVSEYKDEEPVEYLEDLPPKFEDQEPMKQKQLEATYAAAFSQIKLSDFKPSTFLNMPCFREAMITGFQSMGVLGVVTFLIHKNFSRAMNWGVGGFVIGNVISFNQCRAIRRKSLDNMKKAQEANHERNVKKWQEQNPNADDEQFRKWQEVQGKR